MALAGSAHGQDANAGRPIVVVTGESIGGAHPGMTRAQIEALGFRLSPEGIDRADAVGWISGPMLFLFAPDGHATLVSVDVRRSAGLLVGGHRIRANATLAEIAHTLLGCVASTGSGGNALTCRGTHGEMHFYDTFGSNGLTLSIP